jgi:hypothetical protein
MLRRGKNMGKYGDFKIGKKVRLVKELKNGATIFPIGAVGEIYKIYGGLEILFESRCPNCHFGDRAFISRVPLIYVELVEEPKIPTT